MNKIIPAAPLDKKLPRWFAALVVAADVADGRWWPTNGHLMISVGGACGRTRTSTSASSYLADQCALWASNAPSDSVTPSFPYMPDHGGPLLTDMGRLVAQARYVICVERVHPGAKWLIRGELEAMWAVKYKQLVAILMPYRTQPRSLQKGSES